MCGEAANHAYPLWWRGDRDLPFEHRHGVGKAADAIPTQLHIVVQPATDDVQMVVDQPGQHALTLQIDGARGPVGEGHDLLGAADGAEHAVLDGYSTGRGIRP